MYGLLLNRMGFGTHSLECEVVCVPSQTDPFSLDRDVVLETIARAVAKVARFDLEQAQEELEWALGFWRGQREVKPTQKAWECRACQVRAYCPCCLG